MRLFEDWIAEAGLTAARLENVSSFEELDEPRQRGRLALALCGGEIVGFAQALIGEAPRISRKSTSCPSTCARASAHA